MTDPLRPTNWLHRLAVATCCAALLPITIGAIVTTMKWGMAFHDWPSSDGHGMFAYPWFGSAIDKFTEHGHRLAGITIGCFSIVLTAWAWKTESRSWVRWLATAVLAGVVLQGLLGGGRVLANDPRLALLHGQLAAVILALMGTLALVTSQGWKHVAGQQPPTPTPRLKRLAWSLPAVLVTQSALGGWIRHLGGGLFEHVGFALVVFLLTAALMMCLLDEGTGWLKANAWILAGVLLLQLGLGAAAWVTRFGWPDSNYVAVQGAPLQIAFRTAHAVVGQLLLLASVTLAIRVLRLDWITRRELIANTTTHVAAEGGLA
jgi:cytochrome c oxidase assembly protein subunit 15